MQFTFLTINKPKWLPNISSESLTTVGILNKNEYHSAQSCVWNWISVDFEFKIRRFFEKCFEHFYKTRELLFHAAGFFFIQRDFSIHRDFFIPHLNPCFSWRNVIPPFKRREPMMTSATPQSIIGSLGWWTISFLPPFEGRNDTFT